MNTKLLVKLAVTALLAAGTVAGGEYLASDTVSVTAAVNAAVVAALAYLKQSPIVKK